MKSKDLIKLLEKFPEAEVGFKEYIGCDTPFRLVQSATLFTTGSSVTKAYDGGDLIKNGKAKSDLILLETING